MKGEIVLEEEITKLVIEAESAYKIQKFYEEWGVELSFLKIKESEICMKSEKKTNVQRNEIYKETIEQRNLPLFKANKLMKKLEIGLDNLKKNCNCFRDDE